MKNSNYIINGILLVAVIVLFILQFTGRKEDAKGQVAFGVVTDSTGFHLPIAYIRTDSLLARYNFFIDISDVMLKKVEDKKLDMKRREEKLKKEIADFYQKVQENIYYSQERQRQEQDRLVRQQQDLEALAAQVQADLSSEELKMHLQLQDTIISALKQYNTPKKYEMILSNAGTDNILYADDSYDITAEIVEFLNARYVTAKK